MKKNKNTKRIFILGSSLVIVTATALPGSASFLLSSLPLSLLNGSLPTSLLGGGFPTSLLGEYLPISFLPSSFSSINVLTNQISGLQSQLHSFFNDFGNSMKTWDSQLQGQALSVTLGSLGLPDLNNFELNLENIFSNNGEYLTLDEAQHTGVRQATRSHAGQTLSSSGQQAVIDRQTQIQEGVREIDNQAIAARYTNNERNILKRIAIQNAQQGMLLGTVGSEITQLNVKQDLANYNLANISEAIDSQNLARQSDLEGSSLSVLQTSSMLRMD
ncbi:hypothetical protein [Crocosphaera chwakensis]|uniref:Uncharacterized protein n=1 Tax=Crocosphaera chwakensis CCY0110 TaxID=391612 RepID=A3IXB9_9CHRO|nr:hypothetical protein [Crocosphaera chwakensis]EAZ88862.1 hypothetical protein CY0110_31250 [Crocosphaera chwakensis CCY0110]